MGGTATTIAIFYLVVVVLAVAVAAVIAWSTLVRPRLQADTEALAERERVWLVVVLVALVALLFSTIFFTPYGKSAGAGGQDVRIEGFRFAWTVEPAKVRAGEPVEFTLTALDVNHGLGIYDADGTLLAQVQVPPDREQRLVHTFDEPGTYTLLCLEFCGSGHHLMETTLEVTE